MTTWQATSSRIIELGEYLVARKVTCVVMEATGAYWRPFWHLLGEVGLELMLVNPRQARQIPGKKTDVADCAWLADLAAHGLVKPSFVPPKPVQHLKDLVRTRTVLTRVRGQEVQRLEKVLEDAALKLSVAVSDIMGASGRRILDALIGGQQDPAGLAALGDPRLKATPEELAEALTGRFTDHHAFLLGTHLRVVDSLAREIVSVEHEIQRFFDSGGADPPDGLTRQDRADWSRKRELLGTIPGVSDLAAEQILAEAGPDMSVFPTARHFVSWAGAAPGLNQSAGRSKSAKCPKGNKYLKGAVGMAALSIARRPGSFLHSRYRRVCSRRGPLRAVVAVEHSILTAVWHILTTGEPYRELGADYYLRRRPGATIRKAVDHLRAVGYNVTFGAADTANLTPAATPAAT